MELDDSDDEIYQP